MSKEMLKNIAALGSGLLVAVLAYFTTALGSGQELGKSFWLGMATMVATRIAGWLTTTFGPSA